jgi:hypothetical protein
MIRNSHGLHAQASRFLEHLLKSNCTVQKAVLCVDMEVHKRGAVAVGHVFLDEV